MLLVILYKRKTFIHTGILMKTGKTSPHTGGTTVTWFGKLYHMFILVILSHLCDQS